MGTIKSAVSVVDDLFRNITQPPEILVIDDDAAVLQVFQSGITKLGLNVVICQDGREAVEVYRKRMQQNYQDRGVTVHPFDLVLLDLRMPGMPGDYVLKMIREMWPVQPVTIVSGLMGMLSNLTMSGSVGIMDKPVSFDDIRNLLMMNNIRMRSPKGGKDSNTPFQGPEI